MFLSEVRYMTLYVNYFLKLTVQHCFTYTYLTLSLRKKNKFSSWWTDRHEKKINLGIILFLLLIIEFKYKEGPATVTKTKIAVVGEKISTLRILLISPMSPITA